MCVLILYTHAHTHAGLVASFQSMSRQPFSDLGSVTSAHVRASDTLSTVSTSSEVSKSKANVVRVSPHMLVACEGLSTSDQSVLKPQYGKCRSRLTSRRACYHPILRPQDILIRRTEALRHTTTGEHSRHVVHVAWRGTYETLPPHTEAFSHTNSTC